MFNMDLAVLCLISFIEPSQDWCAVGIMSVLQVRLHKLIAFKSKVTWTGRGIPRIKFQVYLVSHPTLERQTVSSRGRKETNCWMLQGTHHVSGSLNSESIVTSCGQGPHLSSMAFSTWPDEESMTASFRQAYVVGSVILVLWTKCRCILPQTHIMKRESPKLQYLEVRI